MKKVLIVEGTWAPKPWGLLGDVVRRLNNDWLPIRIQYPEKYGDPVSYKKSTTIAEINLTNEIIFCQRDKIPYIILGYSQGAGVAGDVGRRFHEDPLLRGVILISDPKRSRRDRQVGPAVVGYGVSGEREIGSKARQIVAPGDFIADNDNPFLTNVASYTYEMGLSDVISWAKAIPKAIMDRKPNGDPIRGIRTVANYIASGVHTKYNTYLVEPNVTATQWVANYINSK